MIYLKIYGRLYCKLFGLLLLCVFSNSTVLAETDEQPNCQPHPTQLSDFAVKRSPKAILLVPLLYKNPDTPRENEHWPEPSARALESFYRGRGAQVTWLRNVRTWQQYYSYIDQLRERGQHFDRVIFIGHGGFDGPLLNSDVLLENKEIKGDRAEAILLTEQQPGNEQVVSLSYQPNENKAFSEYLERNWRELLNMSQDEARAELQQQHQKHQSVDSQCFSKFCPSAKLNGLSTEQRSERQASCNKVCRKSLYDYKFYERVNEDRFWLFANSLRDVLKKDGLIFMGECNAGSPTPKQYSHWDTPGIVVSSKVAGGPYHNYVHFLSTATGRLVAGPIGSSSAEDIVNRIVAMESNQEQRFLCMATPLKDLGFKD